MSGHQIGVIADTHGLLRAAAIDALDGCELIIHAGDVGRLQVLEPLYALAPVVAVRGNVDQGDWARRLPETQLCTVGDVSIYVLHDLSRLDLDPKSAGIDVVISGHSHRPSIETREGVLYLNPGSAGPQRFHLPVTLARLHIQGREAQAELVQLEP